MTLQNAYGDQEFPVRARYRWRKVVAAARRRRNSMRDKALLFGITFGTGLVIIATLWGIGAITGDTFETFVNDDDVVGKFAALIMVIVLLALFVSWAIAFGDAGLPRREQRKYLRLAQATPLSERQAQLLALDAVSDFGAGGWNRSLEYLPVWFVMPAWLQAKHEKVPAFQPFLSFELANVDTLRNYLDQAHSVVSTADVERYLEHALREDSISLKFVDLLSNPDAEDAVRRLASLAGTTEEALRDQGVAPSGFPAPLLWATDVMVTMGFVRNAYAAEYLDAERAWHHLELLARVAFATFSSREEYWANARIGLAFISSSRETVQGFDATYRELNASRWPEAKAGFPHDAAGQIPDVVRNLRLNPRPVPGDGRN